MRTALTIAGSDSIAGAGIQADLKTFAAHGVYGASAVTAITAQSTTGVIDVLPLPVEIVRAQIQAVSQDTAIAAAKTGMLATAEIVDAVSESLRQLRTPCVVVDPVMAASADARTLLTRESVSIFKAKLLPLATVVTPNLAEAAALSGIDVNSLESAREAARRIAGFGPRAVVIKGGHLTGPDAIDLLFFAGSFSELAASRVHTADVHGTGCTFASAIAARLALGDDIPAAVEQAKRYITEAIAQSIQIGRGARILNHFWDRPSRRL
jgi:hydroxymethylpyrimidine/phosphomethylpyrimidine kinase